MRSGPRVVTRPQVIRGPASSGQQVCIGSVAEIHVIGLDDHLAAGRVAHRAFGAMSSTFLKIGSDAQASLQALSAGPVP